MNKTGKKRAAEVVAHVRNAQAGSRQTLFTPSGGPSKRMPDVKICNQVDRREKLVLDLMVLRRWRAHIVNENLRAQTALAEKYLAHFMHNLANRDRE